MNPQIKKIESSNNIASGFWETAGFRNTTEEMCFYITEPNSLPEKLEYTENWTKNQKWRQTKAKKKIDCILLKKLYTIEVSITASFQLVPVN